MPQDPLTLLCIEPRFPGRLASIADWLVRRRGYRCHFYCATHDSREHWPASAGRGMDVVQYGVGGVAREDKVTWMRDLERGLCHAYGCWEVLHARRPRGIDLVLGRSATLGSSLFAPVALPGTPVVNYFDYYCHPHEHDVSADVLPSISPAYFYWRRTANAMSLLDLENGVRAWTATAWQRSLFPHEYQDDFFVLHPGVDTARFRPGLPRPRALDGQRLASGARIVSFIAGTLDRLRGFDRFVQLANRLQAEHPDVLCVVVGDFIVSGGLDVEYFGQDYAHQLLQMTPPHDRQRLWLLGSVPPAVVADVLAASVLHVYPSRPYPLASSLLEAMACGRTVLAWDSEPVREVLRHGETGLLVPADDPDAAVEQAAAVLADPARFAPLGQAAAEHVRQHYSLDVTAPALAEYFDSLLCCSR